MFKGFSIALSLLHQLDHIGKGQNMSLIPASCGQKVAMEADAQEDTGPVLNTVLHKNMIDEHTP